MSEHCNFFPPLKLFTAVFLRVPNRWCFHVVLLAGLFQKLFCCCEG